MARTNWLFRTTVGIARSRAARPLLRAVKRTLEGYYSVELSHRLAAKIAPLSLVVDPDEPPRVELLIPEINFANFYGGYIAKFNLARRLTAAGLRVRLVTVDRCEPDLMAWRELVARYDGLADFFDHVEVATCFDRSRPLRVHPHDLPIATTWWTAHIAHAALTQLAREHFVYLIQEYEPFTFPMGTYYALAHASYGFPHHALFSTALLAEYFEQERYGVYAPGAGGEARHFDNAILAFAPRAEDISARRPRRLLFYARPEPHAARNMFELAYAALEFAIEAGVFRGGEWEFYGIGTSQGDMPLPRGHTLRMLGKVGLGEYRALLPRHDLGLSLMYTPHPSLLPLEMAAAGMLVVTNSCRNKTAEKLAAISSNLIAAEPTLDGVVAGLRCAADSIEDVDTRIAGARVRWPNVWRDSFPDALIARIRTWFEAGPAA